MGPIERAMTTFFDGLDWHYERQTDDSFRLHYDGQHALYECKATAFDNETGDEGLLLFECFCPLIMPEGHRSVMADFCTRVNQRSIYGWMTCDGETGVVRVRSSLYLTKWYKIQPAMVGPVVQFNVNVMDDYLPAIASIIAGELNAQEAFLSATADPAV